jgi:hypothetical protein
VYNANKFYDWMPEIEVVLHIYMHLQSRTDNLRLAGLGSKEEE